MFFYFFCSILYLLIKKGKYIKGVSEMNIDELLGDFDTRYFGSGHKNTVYTIVKVSEEKQSNEKILL